MRNMEWTQDFPAMTGFYWCCGLHFGFPKPVVIRNGESEQAVLERLCADEPEYRYATDLHWSAHAVHSVTDEATKYLMSNPEAVITRRDHFARHDNPIITFVEIWKDGGVVRTFGEAWNGTPA